MSKKILIYGAGAIGRGYVPWLFKDTNTKLYFVEKNRNLRDKLLNVKKYKTYMTTPTGYECYESIIEDCFSPGEEFSTGLSIPIFHKSPSGLKPETRTSPPISTM